MSLVWIVLIAIVLGALVWRSRPRVVVRIGGGRAQVVRGRLPAGLAGDLDAVARLSPQAAGRVEVRGRGTSLSVRTPGLPEGPAQRARNVVYLRRKDL